MNRFIPTEEESRYLLLKIVEQAVRDYLSLRTSNTPIDREFYETACEFLFDDDYQIEYGDLNLSLKDILEGTDVEIIWFREKVLKLKEKKNCEYLKYGATIDDEEKL